MLKQRTAGTLVSVPDRFSQHVSPISMKDRESLSLNDVVTYLSKEIADRQQALREELAKGYQEMAAFNLNMAEEMLMIETEAEHALLRQVSGV
ncbi:hypothetical protein EVJ22_13185 [Exiguobacterium sp. SH0S7]|uniref:hypothetical protein n=1 Tax=Exiguobacterium sp. SH0S7 TaxID=2510951 RepID=UPI00103FA4ED|nr:hypothetical protein [Exiguobacterium sp. SH0S7]TCI67919.1 hypothetical protein EVJ22_13185 [Exiguobacterium sp. SH0S7]